MIKIAHLYPNALSLYGESGNIKALKSELEKRNIAYEIKEIDLDQELNFIEYDFVYLGSGRPEFLNLAKQKLEVYKDDILNYLNHEKILLVTGNALSILDFLGLYNISKLEKRRVSDVLATTSLCPDIIKGFQNTEYLIKSTSSIIFNIDKGYGNNETKMEGYKYHNLYVTSLIGPILARNFKLTEYFIKLLLNEE